MTTQASITGGNHCLPAMVFIVTIDSDPIVRGTEFMSASGIGKECGVMSTATLRME